MRDKLLKGLTDEQIKKLENCKNEEEFLAIAKEEGIELNDEILDKVAGGAQGEDSGSGEKQRCPGCNKFFLCRPTGRDDGAFFLFRKYEYQCPVCGEKFWV